MENWDIVDNRKEQKIYGYGTGSELVTSGSIYFLLLPVILFLLVTISNLFIVFCENKRKKFLRSTPRLDFLISSYKNR